MLFWGIFTFPIVMLFNASFIIVWHADQKLSYPRHDVINYE